MKQKTLGKVKQKRIEDEEYFSSFKSNTTMKQKLITRRNLIIRKTNRRWKSGKLIEKKYRRVEVDLEEDGNQEN